MKLYLLLFVSLVTIIRPFYAASVEDMVERMKDRIEELKKEKRMLIFELSDAEKLQLLFLHMTADPKNKTQAEWNALETRVGKYSLDNADLTSGSSMMIKYPKEYVERLIDAWTRRYDIPARDSDAIKVEALGGTLKADQIKTKRIIFEGDGTEISAGKLVISSRGSDHVDICFSLETFEFNLTPKKVTVVKEMEKRCAYFLWWKSYCKTHTWLGVEFEDKKLTTGETIDFADYMDHRLSERFANNYRYDVAYQQRVVDRTQMKIEVIDEQIKTYQETIDDLEGEN